MSFRCDHCGTEDPALVPYDYAARSNSCSYCWAYRQIQARARSRYKDAQTRQVVTIAHRVLFTRAQFVRWALDQEHACGYCGLPAALVEATGMRHLAGQPIRALGVDRLAGGDYTLRNIGWCCYQCNRIKSARSHSPEVMHAVIGPALARVWRQRIFANTGHETDWAVNTGMVSELAKQPSLVLA